MSKIDENQNVTDNKSVEVSSNIAHNQSDNYIFQSIKSPEKNASDKNAMIEPTQFLFDF